MKRGNERQQTPSTLTRRDFLKTGAAGAASLAAGMALGIGAPAVRAAERPNFLFIIADQLALDSISAHGCTDVRTPNLDRLVRGGVSFHQSYTAYPLCSPARASMFTGRMPSETGVINNGIPIDSSVPNVGQWLGQQGYETIYVGKWHLPGGYQAAIPGFTVLPGGIGGEGNAGDPAVSRSCQGYLYNRSAGSPFLLVASFLQPHDICGWVGSHVGVSGWEPAPKITGKFPGLPRNFDYDKREPQALQRRTRPQWSEAQWRHYLWAYYRHVEMVDAEIGRVLDALEAAGQHRNTVVIMTADHGEGRGRHHLVLKNYLYDEAARVPLIVNYPGRIPAGKQDNAHLVSGTDITPTICDYAGIKPPADVVGRSLRSALEGKAGEWREFVAAEVAGGGRMIRTSGHKYVAYPNDPVEQLFDMEADAGETKNLAADSSSALEAHRKLLKDWEARLKLPPRKQG
jgi:arylsulfatase A-like enzyme